MSRKKRQNPQARRLPQREPPPEIPSGWRSSRRGSRVAKRARRDVRVHEVRVVAADAARTARRTARNAFYLGGMSVVGIAAVVLVLLALIMAINGIARWNARRVAERAQSPEARAEKARDNLLLISVSAEDRATGFLALRYDGDQKQVYGIAIPDGAFVEVPGQGFERMGDSYVSGPEISLAAVTNFFTVPFTAYAIVDEETYKESLTAQSLRGAIEAVTATNLSDEERTRWTKAFDETKSENVALVPLPVKPISVGSQTYFEPQRAEVADLLESWWGVRIGDTDDVTRLIVYNGSGMPGIAGKAAQELIRGGYRVVDTKNADSFDYAITQIVVQRGDVAAADGVADLLGVGEIVEQPSDQQVADIIVIIGKDYKPPAGE